MSVPAVRRLVVGVDGSVESVAALRWACREAALRGAEVHAVHVREELCHSLASYAVPAPSTAGDVSIDIEDIAHTVQADMAPGVQVRVEEVEDPLMQQIRYLDKLVDELAKGRPMEKVLRA